MPIECTSVQRECRFCSSPAFPILLPWPLPAWISRGRSSIRLTALCGGIRLASPGRPHLKNCQESAWHLFRHFEDRDLLRVIFFTVSDAQEMPFLPVPD